ncbi:MAG: hypothetical protein WBN30_11295, partial [Polyangiales bacterium]
AQAHARKTDEPPHGATITGGSISEKILDRNAAQGLGNPASLEAVEEPLEDSVVHPANLQDPYRHEPPGQFGIEHVYYTTASVCFCELEAVRAFDECLVRAPHEATIPLELVERGADDAVAFLSLANSQRPWSTFERDRRGRPNRIALGADGFECQKNVRRGA